MEEHMARTPVAIDPLTDSQEVNFWAKVDPAGACWEWGAQKTYDGYGLFNVNRTGKKRLAHRISYTLLVGVIPEGLELDHLCRNRGCVNPDHLEPVTRAENQRRVPEHLRKHSRRPSWAYESGKNVTGYCKHGHEYTEENTYYYKDGRTDCRTCKANRKRTARA
jgi:hypothetical protein